MTACIVERCTRDLRDHEEAAGQLVCDPCVHRMRAQLAAIPAALIVLRDGSLHRERTGDTSRTGTREAPLPCRMDTLNLIGPAAHGTVHDPHGDQTGQRPLAGVLADWTRLVCEERHLPWPHRHRPEDLAGFLASHLGWASTQGWISEFADELGSLMRQVRGIARVEIRTRAISRPCPNSECGLLSLTRTDWDQYVRCSSCGNAYTDAELNADAIDRAAA